MKKVYLKSFKKSYQKLTEVQKRRINEALRLFSVQPNNSKLRNHALVGKLKNYRSISAGFDLRIVFEEKDNYILVIFIDVGTHNQVY